MLKASPVHAAFMTDCNNLMNLYFFLNISFFGIFAILRKSKNFNFPDFKAKIPKQSFTSVTSCDPVTEMHPLIYNS